MRRFKYNGTIMCNGVGEWVEQRANNLNCSKSVIMNL